MVVASTLMSDRASTVGAAPFGAGFNETAAPAFGAATFFSAVGFSAVRLSETAFSAIGASIAAFSGDGFAGTGSACSGFAEAGAAVEITGFAAGSIGVSARRGLDGGFRIVVAGDGATFGDAGTAVAFIGDLSIALRG